MKDNIQSILKQMTLEEKAAFCTGASAWTTTLTEGLSVHYSGGPSLPDEISAWLCQNGIIEQ